MLIKKKKTCFAILLFTLLFSLSACASDAENVINAAENTEAFSSQIVSAFNTNKESESELQSQFEDELESDQDLSSFKNETAAVFENINNRQDQLNSINNYTSELQKTYQALSTYDQNAVDEDTISDFIRAIEYTLAILERYTADYQVFLDEQAQFFTELGQEDANYEGMLLAIEEMQDLDQELIAIEEELNQALVTLNESNDQLLTQATEDH